MKSTSISELLAVDIYKDTVSQVLCNDELQLK